MPPRASGFSPCLDKCVWSPSCPDWRMSYFSNRLAGPPGHTGATPAPRVLFPHLVKVLFTLPRTAIAVDFHVSITKPKPSRLQVKPSLDGCLARGESPQQRLRGLGGLCWGTVSGGRCPVLRLALLCHRGLLPSRASGPSPHASQFSKGLTESSKSSEKQDRCCENQPDSL